MLISLILLQAAALPAGPVLTTRQRYETCLDLAAGNHVAGRAEAERWVQADGGFLAWHCLGMAKSGAGDWQGAAIAFGAAAQGAATARDGRSAHYLALAGNAWLAAGDADKARGALDAAIESGYLKGEALGEAQLDRARARVASDMPESARADLDRAIALVPANPLAWLLSATLARRQGDLARAVTDIAEARARAADDPAVQLEAGNIAAVSGDAAAAREAWTRVIALAPGTRMADSAQAALRELGAER